MAIVYSPVFISLVTSACKAQCKRTVFCWETARPGRRHALLLLLPEMCLFFKGKFNNMPWKPKKQLLSLKSGKSTFKNISKK